MSNQNTSNRAIRDEIDKLLSEQKELYDLSKDRKNIVKLGTSYQSWFSRALKLVGLLGPDRIAEFRSYYEIDPKRKTTKAANYVIQDYLMGVGAVTDRYDGPLWDVHNIVGMRIVNQMQIVASLASRIGTVLEDVEGRLFADLQDGELDEAGQLLNVNVRAAGAVAGVVLERHLRRVAENHSLKMRKKNPTIADLNDPLRDAGIYDVPSWRKIQFLADVRNMCTHDKKRDPTKEEVAELISGTNQIIGTIF